MSKELLTHSRMASFRMCRKNHQLAYEIGLRRSEDSKALRQGSAGHAGVEVLGKGGDLAEACAAVDAFYAHCPEQFDLYQWQIEHETMRRLVCAYQWRWQDSGVVNVETEFQFRIPLINPETGAPTPNFDLGGKIDAIVRLEDGRLAVKETKFYSEDLDANAPLWRRLRRDPQVSTYMVAARKKGYDVATVLFDGVRKPSIGPTAVPILDADGRKIVLDATGERVRNLTGKKEWRQTGDAEKGYTLQVRPMTPQEWGERLTEDIVSRHEWYFARREIARLDGDLDELQSELWEIQKAIRDAQRTGHWFRSAGKNCQFCPFDAICDIPVDVNQPPMGFEIINQMHPELSQGDSNVSTSITTEAAAACAAEGVSA